MNRQIMPYRGNSAHMTVSASIDNKAARAGFGPWGWIAFLVLAVFGAGLAVFGIWNTSLLSSADRPPVASPTTDMRQQAFEETMEKRIAALVATIFGAGNVRVTLHADLDFSNRQTVTEKFDPDGQVARSSFNRTGGGEPTIASSSTPFEERVDFEISRSTSTIIEAEGTIRKLSAAVLINSEAGVLPAEQLPKIEPLIRTAMGFDTGRGDQLEIAYLPFSTIAPGPSNALGTGIRPYTNVLTFAGIAAGLLLLILTYKMGKTKPVQAPAKSNLPGDRDQPSIRHEPGRERVETTTIDPVLSTSEMRAHVAQLVDQNPDHALAIMRSWLHEQTDQEGTS